MNKMKILLDKPVDLLYNIKKQKGDIFMGISMVSGVGYLSKGFNPFWAFKLISFSSTIAKIFMSSVR